MASLPGWNFLGLAVVFYLLGNVPVLEMDDAVCKGRDARVVGNQ
jgi:hypothetical protein